MQGLPSLHTTKLSEQTPVAAAQTLGLHSVTLEHGMATWEQPSLTQESTVHALRSSHAVVLALDVVQAPGVQFWAVFAQPMFTLQAAVEHWVPSKHETSV